MDWHKLQQTLYNIEPTDISSDYAKLKSLASGDMPTQEPSTDYLKESASVPDGSLQLDRDYSVSDFAKLAGVEVSTKQQLSEKTIGQKIGDTGVAKAFKRGWDNYNRINLSPSAKNDKDEPTKPTTTKKPVQTIPRELRATHRVIKPYEVARNPEGIQKDTYISDEQNNAYRWNGTEWLIKSRSGWKNTNINKQQMFNIYKNAVNNNLVLVPRQSNIGENNTMDNEKDTMQNKSNNAKINPVRLAKFFGGEDTMMLSRAIAKMQQGRELSIHLFKIKLLI